MEDSIKTFIFAIIQRSDLVSFSKSIDVFGSKPSKLAYVTKKHKPREILDFATLTGAVLVALGDRASGLMGNNSKLINKLRIPIRPWNIYTKERVWSKMKNE